MPSLAYFSRLPGDVRRSIFVNLRAGLRPHLLDHGTSTFTSFVHELLAGTACLIPDCSLLRWTVMEQWQPTTAPNIEKYGGWLW